MLSIHGETAIETSRGSTKSYTLALEMPPADLENLVRSHHNCVMRHSLGLKGRSAYEVGILRASESAQSSSVITAEQMDQSSIKCHNRSYCARGCFERTLGKEHVVVGLEVKDEAQHLSTACPGRLK